MNREEHIINQYIHNGGHIYYFGKEDDLRDCMEFISQNGIQSGDAPDCYVTDGKKVIIIEHFEFDCYQTTNKGSRQRQEIARIERKEKVMASTEEGVLFHDIIRGRASYQHFIDNVTHAFIRHYAQIDTYIYNLQRKGIIFNEQEVKVAFLIEDTSPMGSLVIREDGMNTKLESVTLALCIEFLKMMQEHPRVDYVFACSKACKYTCFINQSDLCSYFEKAIDYQAMRFINTCPQIISISKKSLEEDS